MYDTDVFRHNALNEKDRDILELVETIKNALEGDSNDAEHDALVDVAGFFEIDWTSYDDREDV